MTIILGIESTAHTFGIGIVRNGKVLANVKKTYTTETGGIIPMEAAKHHCQNKNEIYFEALTEAGIKQEDINAIAFSQGPGLAPCLLEGMKFAKELVKKLKKPLVPVNHCVAHLEIGKIVGCKNAVMLYASGANTQIIAYESGKYRIFGETLDIGVGNFIDTFARYAGLGFPGGPAIEKLASQSKNYIELPYRVKGMDVALSGILTKLRQMIEKMDLHSQARGINGSEQLETSLGYCATMNSREITRTLISSSLKKLNKEQNSKRKGLVINNLKDKKNKKGSNGMEPNRLKLDCNNYNKGKYLNVSADFENSCAEMAEWSTQSIETRCPYGRVGSIPTLGATNYTLSDLAYSMQETVFAMLVETAERALAHTGKKELLLGGGVACNSRLQEMCKIMCKERGAKLFVPEKSLLVDNGAMIAYLGGIMWKAGIFEKDLSKVDIKPRQRTDDVEVSWK